MKQKAGSILVLIVILALAPLPSLAGHQAEVIHWWVSGGESAALKVLIDEFEARGNTWIDTPVKASYQAKTASISRMFAGNPPTVVQWHVGTRIKQLYQEGLLRDVQGLAKAQGWDRVLPEIIWRYATLEGKVLVAPLTLHGGNWMWASKKVLEKSGVQPPNSWSEFLEIAPKIRRAGFIPLALGGQPWQEAHLFLNILLAQAGPKVYLRALADHDPAALAGPEMIRAFKTFGALREFVDPASPDRSWDDTIRLIIDNKAALQIMGDWAKGELIQAGLTPGRDYLCALAPGTNPYYMAISDAFAMVAVKEPRAVEAQKALALVIMDPEVQQRFNLLKGSIPPRTDVSPKGFDPCARMAMKLIQKGENVVPSLNMANPEIVASAFLDVIHSFWTDPLADPAQAAGRLAKAVKEAEL